ncbi:MAG: flagellar protein FlgN [Rhodospirillales bacterium]|nr:flagellar protein FlgN [Rhodospirillales bacterium]
MPDPTNNNTNVIIEQGVNRLAELLHTMLIEHQQLNATLDRKRQAMREARQQELAQLALLESEKVQAISEMEKQRLALVAELTLAVQPSAPQPLRMGELAEALDEPFRGKLLVLRTQLLAAIQSTQQEAATIRRATESLASHMNGLVRTIGALATGVSTYGSRGALPEAAAAVSTISVTA